MSGSASRYFSFFRQAVRRVVTAERRAAERGECLRQLERRLIKDLNLTDGKISLTGEEPKDFSRVIATNMLIESLRQRSIIDNGTRIVLAVVGGLGGLFGYKVYLGS